MRNTENFYFQSFTEWRDAITVRCNINLSQDYARARIAELQDPSDKSTLEFKAHYGDDYLQQVIEWFQQAEQM